MDSVSKELHNIKSNTVTTELIPSESSYASSPHSSVELVTEEMCVQNLGSSVMCTGCQPLTLSPIYHTATMTYYQPYSLQQQHNNRRQLQAPENKEEPHSCAALEFSPCYSMKNEPPKAFFKCRCSIQETSQRLEKQELVFPNHSVNFWKDSHTCLTTNTYYTCEELERRKLIKPFCSLVPD